MYFEELVDAIEQFNKNSINKITLTASEIPMEDSLICGDSMFHIPRIEPKVEFNLETSWIELVKYNISTYGEYLLEDAFNILKLKCKKYNLRCKISYLVENYCYKIIQEHNNYMKGWNNYLSEWDKHCYSSIYKSFEDAYNASDRFSLGLKNKIKEHLERYYPEILEEINQLNMQLEEKENSFCTLIKDTPLIINTEFRMYNNNIIKYDYDFR